MRMFDKIKRYYDLGYYQKKHLDKLLSAGAVTETQYNQILKG